MLRTKSQQKDICRCAIGHVAHLMGDSAVLLIIRDLLLGDRRFTDLSTSLRGISTRTLTNKLRWLEKECIVARTKNGTYALTEKGKGLRMLISAMRRYEEKYL
jgi:DNA-binding HxlR family transcriptional regulator